MVPGDDLSPATGTLFETGLRYVSMALAAYWDASFVAAKMISVQRDA